MINISAPLIETRDNKAYLVANIVNENFESRKLWYSVSVDYAEFLSPEVGDAFLVALLSVAMKNCEDISVEAPISPHLLFHIRHSIAPMLTHVIPGSRIPTIYASSNEIPTYHPQAVGTGCSLGVDSFSSILSHIEPNCPEDYKLTHLALFNCGQLGDLNLESAEKDLYKKIEEVKPLAKDLGLKVIAVNSNINEFYINSNVLLLQSFVQRTVSVPLALQKLFKVYSMASSYPTNCFELSDHDVSYASAALLPLFSSNSLEFINSTPMMTRVDKTKYIADSLYVQKYLDVCWAAQSKNSDKNSTLWIGKTKKNCGKCDKCLRTLFTLELLGKKDAYADIFDFNEYNKYKNKYIIKCIGHRSKNIMCREVHELMEEVGYQVPLKLRIAGFIVKLGIYDFLQRIFKFSTMAR